MITHNWYLCYYGYYWICFNISSIKHFSEHILSNLKAIIIICFHNSKIKIIFIPIVIGIVRIRQAFRNLIWMDCRKYLGRSLRFWEKSIVKLFVEKKEFLVKPFGLSSKIYWFLKIGILFINAIIISCKNNLFQKRHFAFHFFL